MRDLYDPFRPWLETSPDMNRADERQAAEQMLLRDELTLGFLTGATDLDTLLDCLAEHGIDPDGWIAEVEVGVQRIVEGGISFVQNEHGLFIPER